jgi:response regulator RpfG family c-di-GMP phosphodiesterase
MNLMKHAISILLIGNDPTDLISLRDTLRRRSVLYQLIHVSYDTHALEVIDNLHVSPDIILLDLTLPYGHALEMANRICSNPLFMESRLFVIASTDNQDDREMARNLGAAGYLLKPLRLDSPTTRDALILMIDILTV